MRVVPWENSLQATDILCRRNHWKIGLPGCLNMNEPKQTTHAKPIGQSLWEFSEPVIHPIRLSICDLRLLARACHASVVYRSEKLSAAWKMSHGMNHRFRFCLVDWLTGWPGDWLIAAGYEKIAACVCIWVYLPSSSSSPLVQTISICSMRMMCYLSFVQPWFT